MALAATGAVGLIAAGAFTELAATAAAACHARVSVIAGAQGSPDDLAWNGNQLLVSDINRGTIGAVVDRHVRTLIGHIREPEGIVPRSPDQLEVAEQATNRVLAVNLARHSRTPIVSLPSLPNKTGVDDIEAAPDSGTYVPDSANGDLYLLRGRHLTLLAAGMVRPVGVARWAGGLAVADEYASVVWLIRGRQRSQLAPLPVPDDLTTAGGHLIAVSLLGGVWEIAPHLRLLASGFHSPQGLVADGRDAVIVADQTTNTLYRVAGLSACL